MPNQYRRLQYQRERAYIEQGHPKAIDEEILIFTCDPQNPLPWPYPDDYSASAIAKILRRFRNPEHVVQAVTLSITMLLEWLKMGYPLRRFGGVQPELLEIETYDAWQRFMERLNDWEGAMMDPEINMAVVPYLRSQLPESPAPLENLIYQMPLLPALVEYKFNVDIGSDPGEESYSNLGFLTHYVLSLTSYQAKHLTIPTRYRRRPGRIPPHEVYHRWWELVQCLFPIDAIWGPPITFDEINKAADAVPFSLSLMEATGLMITPLLLNEYEYWDPNDWDQEEGLAEMYWLALTRQYIGVVIKVILMESDNPQERVEMDMRVEVNRDYDYLADLDDRSPDHLIDQARANSVKALASSLPDILIEKEYDFPISTEIETAAQQIADDANAILNTRYSNVN